MNIDLATYQYDVEKLVWQAALLGIEEYEMDFPKSKLYTYAKCFNDRSAVDKIHTVKYIWNLMPCSTYCPVITWTLDIIAFPFCWWWVPCDQFFCVLPWNVTYFILMFSTIFVFFQPLILLLIFLSGC